MLLASCLDNADVGKRRNLCPLHESIFNLHTGKLTFLGVYSSLNFNSLVDL